MSSTPTYEDLQAALKNECERVKQIRAELRAELAPFVLLSSAQLRQAWAPKLKGGARRMFEVLVDAGKGTVLTRQQLGEAAEMGHETGTFSDYLSLLRRNGLIDEPARGMVAPAQELFIGDAP